jgi:DNA repair photolyase
VNFTIGTDSEAVRLRYERGCPSISARFKAAAEVAQAGVKIGVALSPMLPIEDVEAFGLRLASLNAAEYVSQYFHAENGPFAAGTSATAIRKAHEDGWSIREYGRAREALARILGEGKPLLEGAGGFAPP